ncbi:MAG: hypothetical protein ACI9QD_000811 [Thermoproteota archaeon]|jgi:hypothetical protein
MKKSILIIVALLVSTVAIAKKGPCSAIKLRKKYHVYAPDISDDIRIAKIRLAKNKRRNNEEINVFSKIPFGASLGLAFLGLDEEEIPVISQIIKAEENGKCFIDIKFENENYYERFNYRADKKRATIIELMEEGTSNVLLRLQSSKS